MTESIINFQHIVSDNSARVFSGWRRSFRSSIGGFTLMELLVVIAIIGILLGIIIPVFHNAKDKARFAGAKVEAKNLETAFKCYLDYYGTWPSGLKEDQDVEIKDNLFKMLQGEKDLASFDNPKGVVFYEFQEKDSARGAVNAWVAPDETVPAGYRYSVRVDKNYDGKINSPFGEIRRSVIVWTMCETNYITSWE